MRYLQFSVLFILSGLAWATSYGPTTFITENPISDGNKWQVPGSTANQWGNVQSGNSMAYGVSQPTQYGDPTAILSGLTWGSNQTVQGKIKIVSTPTGCCSEVELRVRTAISTNNINGYEVLCPVHNGAGYGFQIVRWNGQNGQYVYLPMTGNTGAHQCVNNDTIEVVVTGSNPVTINVYYNGGGTPYISATDNGSAYSGPGGAAGPWTSGSPGVGFCCQGSTWSNFGITNYSATDGATYIAAGCNQSDVNTLINGPTHTAVDGDTIQVPAGSCTWSSGITVPSNIGITIQGAGTPNSSPSQMGASASCSQTNITLNGAFDAFKFLPGVSSSLTHISCIKFSAASSNHCAAFTAGGTCNSSTCSQLRADNLTFDSSMATASTACSESGSMMVVNNVFGVADHDTALDGSNANFLGIHHSAWQGVGDHGDNSWYMPDTFGTAQTFYAENNSIGQGVIGSENESNPASGNPGGGRLAVRFSSCNQCTYGALVSWHGTDSGQRMRGGRQAELYGSTITPPSGGGQAGIYIRSGTAIGFGNTWTGYTGSYMGLNEFRISTIWSPQWGQCPGVYDQASPLICLDQPCRSAGAYLSGTSGPTGGPTPTGFNNIQQIIDPCYEWNDTGGTAGIGRISPNPSGWASQNRDYYLASFGPIASIPTSCTPGVTVSSDPTRPDLPGQGYGTTNTGTWNQSGIAFGSANQTQGQLYVCKSSNVNPVDINGNPSSCLARNTGDSNYWCLYYTPYTYPHPLIAGGGPGPPPPTAFTAIPGIY